MENMFLEEYCRLYPSNSTILIGALDYRFNQSGGGQPLLDKFRGALEIST